MNRYQHDNIDPDITPADRKRVLEQKFGIGHRRRNERKAQNAARKATARKTKK